MEVWKAKKSFVPSKELGPEADKASMLAVEKGDLFEILEEIETECNAWLAVRALKDNSVGYIPANYMKVTESDDRNELTGTANNRDIHLLALEELKQRPEFQHPDKLFEKAMIPDPDYSDSEEDENSDSYKMSPQPNRVSTTTSGNVNGHTTTTEDGLVLPRKVNNPCLDSKEKQLLHRELLFNQKIGKNVLGQKSELKKVMDKFQDEQKKKELEVEKLNKRTSLEKRLEEQAHKIKMVEEQRAINEKTAEELEPQSEFHRIHAKLRAKVEPQ